MAAVESNLVDLAGVSLETLRSMDSRVLASSLEELQQRIDRPQASEGGDFNPAERFD
ncbi:MULTISPECIES: hypothetical protein [unclassified Streptomyces]|uniref:hypothetical protein n=1 Tax=Streptomyces sp. cf386 TaxID=1761904 RepID=UPI0015A2552A|nr:hypothetical protein [Streptomyces sp. cf386]